MSAPDAILASALNACAWVCVCFHCMSSSVIYCGRGADCVILQTSKWCCSDEDLPTLQITAQINTGWTLGGCQRKQPQFLHLSVSSVSQYVSLKIYSEMGQYVLCATIAVCVCVYVHVCLYRCSCLSVVWGNTHTRSHTSSYSLRGLAAYYESLVGEWRENKRPTTLKWQHRAQTGRFTSLIPAHKDLKELSMWLRETTSIIQKCLNVCWRM